MNPFQVIEWALGLTPKVVDAVQLVAAATRRKTVRVLWDRPHFFVVDDYEAKPWKRVCVYCHEPEGTTTKCRGPK